MKGRNGPEMRKSKGKKERKKERKRFQSFCSMNMNDHEEKGGEGKSKKGP